MTLLVAMDSLTRGNGAHVATRAMVAALRAHGVAVDLLLGRRTDDVRGLEGVTQLVLLEPSRGLRRLVQGLWRRLRLAPVPRWVRDPGGRMRRRMRRYDTVLVVGENSHFRPLVSGLKGPRKVVFIHTDYAAWRSSCGWAIEDSRFDRRIYRGFDAIAVVGRPNADRFAALFPELRGRVCAFHNLFAVGEGAPPPRVSLLAPAAAPSVRTPVRIVTLSRLEFFPQKKTDRLVRVAGALRRRGCAFTWTVYGSGAPADEARLRDLARAEGVADVLRFAGFTARPADALDGADLHVLLSAYEGAPNAVYEALLRHVPCVATDVGAVREMVADGVTGLVVPQDEAAIVNRMEAVLKCPETIAAWKRNLADYAYDNEKVVSEYLEILS